MRWRRGRRSDNVEDRRGRRARPAVAAGGLGTLVLVLAGVWAHHADRARQILEKGDIEEALGAASAIGDDRLQRQSRGYVTPDSFTHGTSAQRVRWFRRGLETGDLAAGDTFATDDL